MSTLCSPNDSGYPLFEYGLLKPGELAFSLVEPHVVRRSPASVRGQLWIRDGIPLFDPESEGQVAGWLLWFDPARFDEAWSAVCSFEPAEQYKWLVCCAQYSVQTSANVLAGRMVRRGSAEESVEEWHARWDPAFTEGLEEVQSLVTSAAPDGIAPQSETPELWSNFFRLQAAYLLLWSIVERYTALRFGPGLEPTARVRRLGEDASFRAAVAAVGVTERAVVDSRDPKTRVRLRADGIGAAMYYYQVRSNLSHRGKSAFRDAQLVYKSVTDLAGIMRVLLTGMPTPPDT